MEEKKDLQIEDGVIIENAILNPTQKNYVYIRDDKRGLTITLASSDSIADLISQAFSVKFNFFDVPNKDSSEASAPTGVN